MSQPRQSIDEIFETLTSGLGKEVRKIYTGREDFKADELLAEAQTALTNLIEREGNKARLDELKRVKQCGHNTQSLQFRIDILEQRL